MPPEGPRRLTRATSLGFLLAMLGMPLYLWAWRHVLGEPRSTRAYGVRELGIFLMMGVLLWIVRSGEGLPMASLGWHRDRLGRSAAWGLFTAVLVYLSFLPGLGVGLLLHWHFGAVEPPVFTPPLWALTLTMLRAGIIEEVFYRGFALERLGALLGRPWAALLLTSIPFGLFHYRQGPQGILLAFSASVVLSLLWQKRRDLVGNMFGHFLVDFIPNVLLPLCGVH